MTLTTRGWVPTDCEARVQDIAGRTSGAASDVIMDRLEALVGENRDIHEAACFNLNPATNVMNPKAEAMLASGLGSRPSLGYPGDKYEMGLEAIEEIEVIAAQLCANVFDAKFAEIRVPSGAIANLYGFMATCKAGDTIIAPPRIVGRTCDASFGGLCGAVRVADRRGASAGGRIRHRCRSAAGFGQGREAETDYRRRKFEPV
jgi:glycine hydroxymethyltransferase